MSELIFEKDYELLQEVTYAYKGNERTTKKVILKAPTFRMAEKLETSLRQLNKLEPIIGFICDAELIVAKEDGTPLPIACFNNIHIKAISALVEAYNKFFLALDSLETENNG